MDGTLYEQMRVVERQAALLEIEARGLPYQFERFRHVPGYEPPRALELPCINVDVGHRVLVSSYLDNPLLREAISGNMSLTERLRSLQGVNRGWRRFTPKHYDEQHNEQVDFLGELVRYPRQLKTRSVYYPDNFITTAVLAGGVMYAMMLGIVHAMDYALTRELHFGLTLDLQWPGITAGVTGPLAGIITMVDWNWRGLPWKEVEYLDKRIEELYHKEEVVTPEIKGETLAVPEIIEVGAAGK